jgi:hypothetical protein
LRANRYRPIYQSGESQLRDELGTIDVATRVDPPPARSVVRLPVIGGAGS